MTTEKDPQLEIKALEEKIKERDVKIEDVTNRIARQEDHISKTLKKKERFEEHRARWVKQNTRDTKKVEDLKVNLNLKEASDEGYPLVG